MLITDMTYILWVVGAVTSGVFVIGETIQAYKASNLLMKCWGRTNELPMYQWRQLMNIFNATKFKEDFNGF